MKYSNSLDRLSFCQVKLTGPPAIRMLRPRMAPENLSILGQRNKFGLTPPSHCLASRASDAATLAMASVYLFDRRPGVTRSIAQSCGYSCQKTEQGLSRARQSIRDYEGDSALNFLPRDRAERPSMNAPVVYRTGLRPLALDQSMRGANDIILEPDDALFLHQSINEFFAFEERSVEDLQDLYETISQPFRRLATTISTDTIIIMIDAADIAAALSLFLVSEEPQWDEGIAAMEAYSGPFVHAIPLQDSPLSDYKRQFDDQVEKALVKLLLGYQILSEDLQRRVESLFVNVIPIIPLASQSRLTREFFGMKK